MTGNVVGWLYLFVSIESVALQIASLVRLRGGSRGRVQRHLVRTVATRVGVYSIYAGVATINLIIHAFLSTPATAIFTAVAVVWQINSLADARLGRELANNDKAGAASHGER